MEATEINSNNAIEQNTPSAKGALHYSKMEMIEDLRSKFPNLQNFSPEEAEENLIYGMHFKIFTEKAKIKNGVAYTSDEDSLIFLMSKKKKQKLLKIFLLKITDISVGKQSGNFNRVGYLDSKLKKIDDKCCLTIHYDNNFKYFNFIFESVSQLELFILGIIRFLDKTIMEEIKICNTDLLTLKKIWKEYDPNHNKYLNVDQFSNFLENINFSWKKKKYDQIFKEIDLKKEGKIQFKDFISFYELIVTGEEFREVFQKYSSDPNKKFITMRGLADFMEKEQHVKMSSQEILSLVTKFSKKTKKLLKSELYKNKNNANDNINNDQNNNNVDNPLGELDHNFESMLNIYENHSFGINYTDFNFDQEKAENFKNAFTLTFREFVNMIIDKYSNSIYNYHYFSIHQNMNLPLSCYYIHSSHNTYLEGNQFSSKCSIEMYLCVLKNGCRLVELDCWDGRNGVPDEPIITHWHFPVGEISFKEVLQNIKENAFKKSEYPVILSLENHCSPGAQLRMEKYFREILEEENLYIVDTEKPPLNYPSPNELKRKFIIKCKRKRIFGNLENMFGKLSISEGKDKKYSSIGEDSNSNNNQIKNGPMLNLDNINSNNDVSSFVNNDGTDQNSNKIMIPSPNKQQEINLNYFQNFEEVPNNPTNKKLSLNNLVQKEEIIQEEDCTSKGNLSFDGNEANHINTNSQNKFYSYSNFKMAKSIPLNDVEVNYSDAPSDDIEENIVANTEYLLQDDKCRFIEYIDDKNKTNSTNDREEIIINGPDVNNIVSIIENEEANINKPDNNSSSIKLSIENSPANEVKSTNQNNMNNIRIDFKNKNENLLNVNLNLNVNTYNITNNYYTPNQGSFKNLTNTGCFTKTNVYSVNNINNLPTIENENDFVEIVKLNIEEEKSKEENGSFSKSNNEPTTNVPNFVRKSLKEKRKKSFTSHESLEIVEKYEAMPAVPTTSNQLLKKLKIKYSVDDGGTIISKEKEENLISNNGNSVDVNLQAEIVRIKEIKNNDDHRTNKPPIKTVDKLATVVGMVGVKYKKEDFEHSQYLPWECISISEPDFEKYIKNIVSKIKIIKFCQRGFLKIYPDVMKRTNSSNHDPIECWSAGVQIAALNLQTTDDDWVLVNKIFFKINGGSKCGYILKPDILLNPNLDESIKRIFWKPVFKIKFKVLSGFHLHLCFPKSTKISGIFVEVSLRTPSNPLEDIPNNNINDVLTTDTISNNFLHPVWQSNSKQFEIYDPDLSFIVVKIFSHKKQHVLARSVIPVRLLNLGYRVLDLYDNLCSKYDSSFLIVKTNKIFLN